MFQALIAGVAYPFRAFRLITGTPRMWRFVLVPILVNVLVGATLYAGLLLAGFRAIDGMVATLPAWAAVFGVLLRVVLVVLLLIATGFVLVRFGVVLGSPWYARMSAQIEQMQPDELKSIREVVPDMPFLIPGIGAQGGDLKETISSSLDKYRRGAIINVSRDVLYASYDIHFGESARKRALEYQNKINLFRFTVDV